MSKKKVLITAFHNLITKNVLNTEAFSIIKNQNNLQIILVVPDNKLDFFKNIYEDKQTVVVGVNLGEFGKNSKIKFFSRFFYLLLDSHYLHYKKRERLNKNKSVIGYIKYLLEYSLTKLIKFTSWLFPLWRWLFIHLVHP